MISMDLSGKVAVVTGGSRGLGLAISQGLARAGASVAIASRKIETCEAVAAEIVAAGGQASAHAFHAGRWADCDRLFAEVTERWGGAQILVNNAGKSPVAPSSVETSEELYDMVFAVNLKSVFRLSALFGAQMKAAGSGAIVNISSTGTLRPDPSFAPYAAAKTGVSLYTTTFAQEFGPEVRVNTVMPGPFHTDATKAWSRTQGFTDYARRVLPLGRAGEPREIVGAVLYLVSDLAAFTTGACIKVDGGHSIAKSGDGPPPS
ncbi:glucose 1-dehydrogenase [Phenylobacterium sp. LjRoot225]|uniref:SDR family NAD(P)-dependent oxidoreductase n=1 Tax=Phenylobacterium sp. LjRoot225 TaxID=3342285 RepID=UPI003ECFCB85